MTIFLSRLKGPGVLNPEAPYPKCLFNGASHYDTNDDFDLAFPHRLR